MRDIKVKKAPKVAIVILNYMRANDTIECMESILNIDYKNYEIILVDNHSRDDSVAKLKMRFPESDIFSTGENLGYTGGINFGVRKAQSLKPEYILLLNNDTIVEKTFLTELVHSMETFPEAAAMGGLILAEHDRRTVWYAGGTMIPWRGLAVHNHKGKNIEDLQLKSIRPVSFITGCMIMFRAEKLDEVGLQDERFFMYLDDIEYSARMKNKGLQLLFNPKAIIYHKVLNETENPFKLYYSVRNRLLLISVSWKGLTRWSAVIYFLTVILAKLIWWRFTNRSFYSAGRKGLADYFNKNFYKGNGFNFLASDF
ncbi:MAG: glycosyltransferase family 2 protein [Calditrichaceae bacterium]